MLMLVLSMNTLAASRLICAKTVSFPNTHGGGWSNQFTLTSKSSVSIGISITQNNQAYTINKGLTLILENVNTKKNYSLKPSNLYNLNYTLQTNVPAGTYCFGVYYKGIHTFKLRFSISANGGGLDLPASLQVMKGTTETVKAKPFDGSAASGKIRSVSSSAPGYATASYDNTKNPPRVTVTGVAVGSATITVRDTNGNVSTMAVTVTPYVPAPTLNLKDLTMDAGDKVYNAVENAVSTVTWSSSNKSVAKVSKNGRIRAVGYGKCTIRAKTVSNNKTYDLACVVKVNRTRPNFKIKVYKYQASKKRMKVKVENHSNVPMVFKSKGAMIHDLISGRKLRTAKIQTASTFKVPSGKKKTFWLKFKGKKLEGNPMDDIAVIIPFTQDKRDYIAHVFNYFEGGHYTTASKPDKFYATY